jgi:hypothetical protein
MPSSWPYRFERDHRDIEVIPERQPPDGCATVDVPIDHTADESGSRLREVHEREVYRGDVAMRRSR